MGLECDGGRVSKQACYVEEKVPIKGIMLTLSRSTLSWLSMYVVSLFFILRKLIPRLENIQKDFFRDECGRKKKASLKLVFYLHGLQ